MNQFRNKVLAGLGRPKQLAAGAVTALILAVVLVVAVARTMRPGPAKTPEECLDRMYQAMRDGDVATYLDCHTGELRAELDNTVQRQSPQAFADYLRRTAAPIKGRAILHHKTQRAGPDRVRMTVDRVYQDRQWEYQAYRLRREADGWRIYAIDPAQPHEPPVPYGTPAIPLPPEKPAASNKPAAR